MHNGQLTMQNAELTIENDQFRLYAAGVLDRSIDGAAVRKAVQRRGAEAFFSNSGSNADISPMHPWRWPFCFVFRPCEK